MLNKVVVLLVIGLVLPGVTGVSWAGEVIFPRERQAYYAEESIELAVAGLAAGEETVLALVPQGEGAEAVEVPVQSEGSTVILRLPPNSMAPGTYSVRAGDGRAETLTVSDGVDGSTFMVSQTGTRPPKGGANFNVGNAFSFGRIRGGQPVENPRGRMSQGLSSFERAVREDLPSIVYMYWTGYVTHKPWGIHKSWAAPHMVEMMRMFNFHTAQRVRRYSRNIRLIGTLDEPGLAWGKTPAGGSASGFADWDSRPWYEKRGWKWTKEPASRPPEDWLKYVRIRCGIIGENNRWAHQDINTVWPEAVFSTDIYAPHAMMDGTDPMNQRVNDIPSSHVFVDWGIARHGAGTGVMLEKCHDPASKLAHAMNGQLFAETVAQPAQRHAYRATLNSMLTAGLYSNWWLNTRGMKPDDLAAVNEPAKRLGPLFHRFAAERAEVAVLWSFTEIAMRLKDITAREAKKEAGEQIKLMVSAVPEDVTVEETDAGVEMTVNAYSIGQNYKDEVLTAHQAVTRAGYTAHIVHEDIVTPELLDDYRALVVVGQTFDLPAETVSAIEQFEQNGGSVVVTPGTMVDLPGATVAPTTLQDWGFRWGRMFRLAKKPEKFESPRQASYYTTNEFMDSAVRDNVAPLREALGGTDAARAVATDGTDLLAAVHQAGEARLYMLLNVRQELPEVPGDQEYPIYSYAAQEAAFRLEEVEPGATVFAIEGPDWEKFSRLADPAQDQQAHFAPGEMKLYLVLPADPEGIELSARARDGVLRISARLDGSAGPLPVRITVEDPSGESVHEIHRALDERGRLEESIPVGRNVAAGAWQVGVESPVGRLSADTEVTLDPSEVEVETVGEPVRVFDGETMEAFLTTRPELVIAVARADQRPVARELASALREVGLDVKVQSEADVWEKARYPRVWDPYIRIHRAGGERELPEGAEVSRELRIRTDADGRQRATTAEGEAVTEQWRTPGTLLTVVGKGFIDFGAEKFYDAGVELLVGKRRRLHVVRGTTEEVKATPEVRRRWSRPWTSLRSYVGTDKLTPQLSEAYFADSHLILLGDSTSSELVRALQASELLPQVVDGGYPGPGRSLVSFAWSPFALEKNVLLVGASDQTGLEAGARRLAELARKAVR